MTKIVAQAQVWNCAQFITASIMPIHKYVDEIWLFDGAYKHMKKFTKVPWSTDGTEEIVKALKLDCKLIWIPCTEFFETELAKRKFMIKHLNDGEWMYELHDDEIASMDIKTAFQRIRNEKKAQVGRIPMLEFPRAQELFSPVPKGKMYVDINPYEYILDRELHALRQEGGQAFLTPRFWKNEGMYFTHGISDIYDGQGRHFDKWPHIKLDEMFLWHLKWLREPTRHKMQLDYEKIPTSFA